MKIKNRGAGRRAVILAGLIMLALAAAGPAWADDKSEVRSLLAQKGKVPWLERDLGYGVASMEDGALLRENFDALDRYEAHTRFTIHDYMPDFAEGYSEDQEKKANALSRALEDHLRAEVPYPFKALAGDGKVDVVNLIETGGREAYAFIIVKTEEGFVKTDRASGTFYYDVPLVMNALEKFVDLHPEMDRTIWLSREGSSFFMFVIQKK